MQTQTALNLRDQLRSLTVGGQKQFATQTVIYDGAEFEVRQPSVKQRAEILKASGLQGGSPETANISELQILATIYCTYVPNTSERVFEITDKDALLEQPTGSFVDTLSKHALELMNVEAEAQGKG